MLHFAKLASAAVLAAAFMAGSASAQEAETAPVAHVAIRKDGDDWSARYRFDVAAPAWLFTRSALAMETEAPWRPEQFEILTPGVTLETVEPKAYDPAAVYGSGG